ncbi:MAG: FAD-binding dehydrogenase [Gammaproteobacteria bacterium]|nr:FAD-binding dehydrogenase [Gammaproteobacteria bacterium]
MNKLKKDSKSTEVLIVGAGIAGLVCALELLKSGKQVTVIDAQDRNKIGGLARLAFGGMALIDTPEQRSKGVKDSPELAYKDWCSFAEFGENDEWPKAWAKYYVENSITEVYEYIRKLGVKFLPAVNWVERGLYTPGNSLPRYHILWGASLYLVEKIVEVLSHYEGKTLTYEFNTKVENLIHSKGQVSGCIGINDANEKTEFLADKVVIACGGFTGNLDMVREFWPKAWGKAPQNLLNGSHPSNDGHLHQCVETMGGAVTHKSDMWNYAAGVPNPKAEFENQGLSLIPSKSALWVDHQGKRIGPEPLVTGFDTNHMCQQISQLQLPHTWQILNRRIALKEFAISGCEHNPSIRDKKFLSLLNEILLGNKKLVNRMINESDHFIVANDLPTLVEKMNQLTPEHSMDYQQLSDSLNSLDNQLKMKPKFWNDDQIRRILQTRNWLTDKLRTCYPKPIQGDLPLIAIKLNIITRKSLGGIQTDMQCRALNKAGQAIEGLYAIGEAAGFGGGGASGKRSLEGTFLSGCILTARQAARSI